MPRTATLVAAGIADYLHRNGRTVRGDRTVRDGRTVRADAFGRVVTLVTPGRRRDMSRLMASAGLTPTAIAVRSGEAALSRVIGAQALIGVPGAQAPSGVPVVVTAPTSEPPRRVA